MTPTTRRHPRTLAEAFQTCADYACAVERPAPGSRALRLAGTATAAIATVALAAHTFVTLIGSPWQ